MNSLITKCPTMANPSALHTVPELRIALEQANSDLLDMSLQVSDLKELAIVRLHLLQYNVKLVVEMLKLHKSGDRAKLDQMLDKNLAAYEKTIAEIEAEKKGSVH